MIYKIHWPLPTSKNYHNIPVTKVVEKKIMKLVKMETEVNRYGIEYCRFLELSKCSKLL